MTIPYSLQTDDLASHACTRRRWLATALAAFGGIGAIERFSLAGELPKKAELKRIAKLNAWLTETVREGLPGSYEDKREWGGTKKVWDGLKVWQENGRIETKRRWKEVNDGTWKMYGIDLPKDDDAFAIELGEVAPLKDGRLAIDVKSTAKFHAWARIAQWELGVQLISFRIDSNAKAELTLTFAAEFSLDRKKLPPDLVIKPEATAAKLQLLEFEVESISDLRGPIVRELSQSLRGTIERQMKRQEDKIVEKLNKSLKKHGAIRLSASDYADKAWDSLESQWNSAKKFIPGL